MTTTNTVAKIELERTLTLNSKMQSQLLLMRENIERLLSSVKETYNTNEELLKEGISRQKRSGVGMRGAYLKGGTFYLKGNMFFKDEKCRTCPNNEDYEKRKNENEMFPMDLNLRARHVWSTGDKKGVILGIKEQVIDYLQHSAKRGRKRSKDLDSEKLTKLLNMVSDDFKIDWDDISSCNLSHRHSAKNCEAIWNLFLHPSLNRSAWSEEENSKLLDAAKKHDFQNWEAIAEDVGQRSDFQCFVQYKSSVCQNLPESYTKWSKEDDKRLLDVIARNTVNGNINWSNVNTYFPHKAKTTLHFRYNFTLNPHILRGAPFTPEEDLLLIAAVEEYGKKFSCIPRSLFPNRSVIQLRGHYNNVLIKRHKTHPWTLEDDVKLMDFVTTNGAKWLDCEKFLESRHTRLSCRTRYFTIKKYLEKNPDCTIENLPRKQCVKIRKCVTIDNWKEKVKEISTRVNGKTIKKSSKKNVTNCVEKEKVQRNKKDKVKSEKKGRSKPDVKLEEMGTGVTKPTKSIKRRIVKHNEKPYIYGLRLNERKIYNFFKYAYNFDINSHPCANIAIRSNDFATALSTLNPQILSLDFDSSIPQIVKQNIMENSLQSLGGRSLQLLSPSWSTAMGFRALCVNTTDVLKMSTTPMNLTNYTNDDNIRRFRNRLRSIFYSTALLSRLDPGMLGINFIENSLNESQERIDKANENVDSKCIFTEGIETQEKT